MKKKNHVLWLLYAVLFAPCFPCRGAADRKSLPHRLPR